MLVKRHHRQLRGRADIVFLVRVIAIFVVMSSERATGWQINVENQEKTCFLYKPITQTCFIQSRVGGMVNLNLHITPDSKTESDLHQLPPISWFRRVKMQKRFVLKVVDLLVGGSPPPNMILSPNRTSLTILDLRDYDVFRNSFKATVGNGEGRLHQNFVIQSTPVVLHEPPPGGNVAVHTQDYMIIGGVEVQYEWTKEGSLSLPHEVYIDPTATTLIIEHYNPVNDAGVYVCDAYNDKHYFAAGRRFVLGKAGDDKTSSDRVKEQMGTVLGLEHRQHKEEYGTDAPFHQESKPNGPSGNDDVAADLEIPPVDIDEMLHTFQNDGDFTYVLQGSTQYLACLPSNMAHMSKAIVGLKFSWRRPKSKGDDVIMTFDHNRYFTIDGGILQITSVHPVDTGILECEVSYPDPRKGTERKKTFTYDIEVYTLPDLIYSVAAGYAAPDCNDQQGSVFKQQLGTHLQSSIIAIDVSFQIANLAALCVLGVPGSPRISQPAIRGHGTRLLVMFDVIIRHKMIAECSSRCMIGELDQRMGLIQHKLAAFFDQQRSNGMYVQGTTGLIPASVEHSLQYHCSVGYGLHASLCLACGPGRYSRVGRVKCSQCPVGTYQTSYGAGDCSPCPPNQITFMTGSTSPKQCRVKSFVIVSIVGGVALCFLAVLVLSFFLRRSGRQSRKKSAEEHELVAILNSDTEEASTDTESERNYTSHTKVSRAVHKSKLEGLLDETSSDEDIQSQIYRTTTFVDQSTADNDEEVDILNVRRQESKHDQDDDEQDLDDSTQKSDVLVSFASPRDEDSAFKLEPNDSRFKYADQVGQTINEPIDDSDHSRITYDLVQIDQPQYSAHHLAYDEPIVPHYTPQHKTSVEAQLTPRHSWGPIDHPDASLHSASLEHVNQAHDQPTLPRPQQYLETSLPSRRSSHVHSLPKESFHQGQPHSPSHQQLQNEDVHASHRFLPPLSNASLIPRSPSTGRRPTPPVSPSLISMDSRANSLPFRPHRSPSSSEPESPRSRRESLTAPISDSFPQGSFLRPPDLSKSDRNIEIKDFVAEQARLSPREDRPMSSKSYLPRSSFAPADLSDSDSEFEIENQDHLLPREDIPRSRSSSRPQLPRSLIMLPEPEDSDSELEIENFLSEGDHLMPREDIPRSRSSSRPQLPRSSIILPEPVDSDSELEMDNSFSERDHLLPREDIPRSRSSSKPQLPRSSIMLPEPVDSESELEIDHLLPREDIPRSRSSSKPQLPRSLIMLPEPEDSDSELEIDNSFSERDHLLPREDIPRSRSSSKPQLPRSSIMLPEPVDSESELEIDHLLPREDIPRSRSSSKPQLPMSSIMLPEPVDSDSVLEIENFVSEREIFLPREDIPRSRSSSKPQLPMSSIMLPEPVDSDSELEIESFVSERDNLLPREDIPRSRSSSKPHLPRSSVMLSELADSYSHSEVKKENFVPEIRQVSRQDSLRSARSSKPEISPRRSSVSTLIASYQSLTRAGPGSSPPSFASLISPDIRSVGPSSPKASSFLSPGQPNTVPSLMPSSTSESVREDLTQSRHSHRATSGSIEPDIYADTSSLARSPGDTIQQNQSRVLTRPSSNNEHLLGSKFKPESQPSIISIQKSVLSAEEPTLARGSSHFTGRPMNPFKQRRLRRESLAAQVSSHHTSSMPSQQSIPHHSQASLNAAPSAASTATPPLETPPPPPPANPNVKKASTLTMHVRVSSTRVPAPTSSTLAPAPPLPPPPADDGPPPGAPPPQGSTGAPNEHPLPTGNPTAALINQAKRRKSGPKFLVSESVKEVSRTKLLSRVSATRVPAPTSSTPAPAPAPPPPLPPPPADDGPPPGAPPPQGSTGAPNEHPLPTGNPTAALINQAKRRKSGPKFLVSESVKEVSRTKLLSRVSATRVPAPTSSTPAPAPAPPPPLPPPPADDGPPPGAPPPQGSTEAPNEHPLPTGNPIAALINQAKSRKSGPKFLVSESVKEVSKTKLRVPARSSSTALPPSPEPSGSTPVPPGVIPPPPPPPPMPPLLLD